MNRRQLLQAGLFSTGCVLAGYRSVHAAPTQQKPKIVIIGAGLSGLASAWELRKKGLDVVILEATKRVGGRVLTDRDNFLDGQYTEHGATLIPDNHDLTLSYVLLSILSSTPSRRAGQRSTISVGNGTWRTKRTTRNIPGAGDLIAMKMSTGSTGFRKIISAVRLRLSVIHGRRAGSILRR